MNFHTFNSEVIIRVKQIDPTCSPKIDFISFISFPTLYDFQASVGAYAHIMVSRAQAPYEVHT